ncbi:MAG: hypothetical protein ABJO65_03435 [Hyphomicrobiales bacterium]
MSKRLHAFVSRGKHSGALLFPHLHEGGTYVVSITRYEADYIHLNDVHDILLWLEKGYRLRMSNPDIGIRAPSLIKPEAIYRPVAL